MTAPAPPGIVALEQMREGTNIRLVPAAPDDVGAIAALTMRNEATFRWMGAGGRPDGVEAWRQQAVHPMLVQARESGMVAGMVAGHRPDVTNGHCTVGAGWEPNNDAFSLTMQGSLLYVEYLFAAFQFRKLYFEVIDGTAPVSLDAMTQLVRVEARLRDHHYAAGRYRDLYVFAIRRDEWEANADPLLDAIQGPLASP